MKIAALSIYPLKSGRGIALTESAVDAFGLPGDRRLLLVAPDGQFITQRELPELARLIVLPEAGFYRLSMEGKGSILVPRPDAGTRKDVSVWKSIISAALCDPLASATVSGWLGQTMELVYFDEMSRRTASREWAGDDAPVTFTDGYQVLITTTGSLAALNADMKAHGEGGVGMERFRPNIVLDCDEPWAEDRWASLDIGSVRFDLVKPCARCIMTTQDQMTGSRGGPSPMPAMGRLRMSADRRVPGPLFGWNAVPRGEGLLRIGDVASVTAERPEGWALKRR